MMHRLETWASARGYRVAWGPPGIVAETKHDVLGMGASGELEAAFFQAELDAYLQPDAPSADLQVVMVAVPRPAHEVRFERGPGEAPLKAVLPPTYVHYRRLFETVREDLATHGLPGSLVTPLQGPFKAVAARLGLVQYGRNNITYAPDLGSYLQLCGYWTDAALPAPTLPGQPGLMTECEGCDRCRKACPTGAIGTDRMLLHAERCLSHANENPGVWPAWAASGPHRCLVGCLLCQKACPANPRLEVADSGVTFSHEETAALLDGPDYLAPDLQASIKAKLAQLGPEYLAPSLGRNLQALAQGRAS